MFDWFVSPAVEFITQEIENNAQWVETVTEYYDTVFDFVKDVAKNSPSALPDALHSFYDTLRTDLIEVDPSTDTVTFPAFARGIGFVRISDSSTQGYHTAEGTIYFPQGVSAGDSVTLFSAEGGLYKAVFPASSSPATPNFKRIVGGDYYYSNVFYTDSGTSNAIELYWSGTKIGGNMNGIYISGGQSNFYPQYPATLSSYPQYACRLKYWTFNTYSGGSPPVVTNVDGQDVPTDVTVYNIPIGGIPITYDDYSITIYNIYNQQNPSETLPSEYVPNYDEMIELVFPELTTEPVTEPTEPATDINGEIVINNYDTLNIENSIEGNANIEINGKVDSNVNIGAGAFGAGAFGAGAFGTVDVDINAGAFGAGAFGAGAIGVVDVSGAVNIDDFILNLDGSLDIPGITLQGATINNYDGATITQNNYSIQVESGASIELPPYPVIDFTLDYDEILSERELETILNVETYQFETLETSLLLLDAVAPSLPADTFDDNILLAMSSGVSAGKSLLDGLEVWNVFIPLAVTLAVASMIGR